VTRAARSFDIVVAGVALIVLAPVLAVIAAAIRVTDGRPIFFRQERIGRHWRPFHIIKFRTMTRDAERTGLPLTVGADPRISPIGRILRRWKLDELPQLINVARGEMTLVGPRPEVRRYVDLYTPAQQRVLDYVPGCTDPASVTYIDEASQLGLSADPEETYIRVIMPDKLRLSLAYGEYGRLAKDLRTIWRTLTSLLRGRGRPRVPVGAVAQRRAIRDGQFQGGLAVIEKESMDCQ
jgi:lipopolysaccharide/colanic/teichoic acid biosynthesis glycosyltransferase